MLWGRTCPTCDSCGAFGVSVGPKKNHGILRMIWTQQGGLDVEKNTYFTSCDPHRCTYPDIIYIYIYIYYRYIFLHSIWQTSSRTFYLTYHTGHSICRCTWHHTRHSIWYSDIQYYFTSSLTSYLTLCLASYPTLSRIFWPTNIFSASLTFDILCDAVPGIILDIFFDIFWHTIWHLLWHSIWRCAWHHTWHSIVRPQTVWQNVHKWI